MIVHEVKPRKFGISPKTRKIIAMTQIEPNREEEENQDLSMSTFGEFVDQRSNLNPSSLRAEITEEVDNDLNDKWSPKVSFAKVVKKYINGMHLHNKYLRRSSRQPNLVCNQSLEVSRCHPYLEEVRRSMLFKANPVKLGSPKKLISNINTKHGVLVHDKYHQGGKKLLKSNSIIDFEEPESPNKTCTMMSQTRDDTQQKMTGEPRNRKERKNLRCSILSPNE